MSHEVVHKERAILLFESSEEEPWHLQEMRALASSAGVQVSGEFFARQRRRHGQQFISTDRAEELYNQVVELEVNVVIVAQDLSASEHAELSEAIGVKVVDRTQLILDIFALRAHTREGKLQVELAQVSYLLPRLSGAGIDMSRLGGGVGTRGPGETKLESDRRRLRKRIDILQAEIDKVKKQRVVSRAKRNKIPFPAAALVGYTSAGKSTVLNLLTGSDVVTDSQLFSTLDPTTRRVVLPDGWAILLTDTVGFIRELPHSLVAAFRATLEEVDLADILVHVVDASHPNYLAQIDAVNSTLAEIGIREKPVVMVYNKSDLLQDTYELRERVTTEPYACYISALKREGISTLLAKVTDAVESLLQSISAFIPYDRSDLVSGCYDYGKVIRADYREDGIYIDAEVARSYARNLAAFLIKPSRVE